MKSARLWKSAACSLILAAGAILSGCSAGGEDDEYGYGYGDGGPGTGGSGASTGGSGAGTGGGYDPGDDDAGGPVPPFDDDEEVCAGLNVDPEPIEVEVEVTYPVEVIETKPIAIYIMLDRSGSMAELNKWANATTALTSFFNDPNSQNLDVALQFYPGFGQCDGSLYNTPTVPMGRLPGHAGTLLTAMSQVFPLGNTPIEGALLGLTSFCASFQATNPDEQCVGILVTDGLPTDCNLDGVYLAGIAGNALNTQNVKTFAVGFTGADMALLNEIARQGGTDCDGTVGPPYACDVSAGSSLLQALEAIREFVTVTETHTETHTETQTKILQCEWKIPPPPKGENFNRDMVNVVFSEPGEDDLVIGRVSSESKCAKVEHGWYYDDPEKPKNIIVCSQTCDMIKSAEKGQVEIQFGCKTEPAILE